VCVCVCVCVCIRSHLGSSFLWHTGGYGCFSRLDPAMSSRLMFMPIQTDEFVFFSRGLQALDLNMDEVLITPTGVASRVAVHGDKYATLWGRCVGVIHDARSLKHAQATAKKAKARAEGQAEAARRAAAEEEGITVP
jgi:hypothetical protein